MREIRLVAQRRYENPYTDVEVWADLEGPGFAQRVHGFWSGGQAFAIRVVATGPGRWRWRTGASVDDPGLQGLTGAFDAEPWTDPELQANPLRHGFLQPAPNGRALQHVDGTPCFLLGDTWWSVGTWRYRWRDSEADHGLGPDMGFKEMVRLRRSQGFNAVAVIAALPAWANEGHPATLLLEDGTPLRAAWPNLATGSALDMHSTDGHRPFRLPGRVPRFEDVYPDVDRIEPRYFEELDRKLDHLNANGFVVFLEPTRRDHSRAWKRYYDWPLSYARFVHYVWSRYGAHHAILSPIHLDSLAHSITPQEFSEAIDLAIERWGLPPFCRLVSANPHQSARQNFGDDCVWLTLNMAGNGERYHDYYQAFVTGDFESRPVRPCLNGEPQYAGWYERRGGSVAGTPDDDLDCRSAAFGSVLSGGLAGHFYGAQGVWNAEIEGHGPVQMWEGMRFRSAAQMHHVREFLLSAGDAYTRLAPHPEAVVPNRTGPAKGFRGWAFAACTEERDLVLLYFEPGCPKSSVVAAPESRYELRAYDPETGTWIDWGESHLESDSGGVLSLSAPPPDRDLAVLLRLVSEEE